ncbi:seryl-tRNA synthetase [Cokeromyces recurvatus]|uniref:seryl-tRNA synthetase n=1 Tax=Cokeromyces recurvatus TaxID=90255 RepID=UPI0022205EE5|nr:seryl-tRNA synthetase [Cokeromyces recurvatus]KAI7905283.1 seryl-tRNA synthetase [Cokeromyces recurvatus]
MTSRNYETDPVYRVKELYEQRSALQSQSDQLRADRDAIQQKIRQSSSNCDRYVQEAKNHKERLKQIMNQLIAVDAELLEQALQIPNETHVDVPRGSEANARVIKTVGKPLQGDALEDHVSIAQRLDLIDFEQASLISGSKFYYLKNGAAWLEWALIQYAMQKAALRGFEPVLTPDIVKTSIAYGCGFQPRKREASQIYDVSTPSSNTQMCLVGTAEIPLAGLMAKKMLNEEALPKRMVGFSHAFRAEAGHGSAEERGLYRVHQFSKVELFTVTTPQQSEAMLEELRELQEDMFRDLELCFRVLDMPTEELGASAYRKYDIEAWLPGKNGWGEISSTSNCTNYQSRRLDIRYLSKDFKEQVGTKDVRVPWHIKEKWVDYCHTLNGTAMAVPRMIIALLETHQRPDGTVHIPLPLRKWIPGEPSVLQ